MEIVVVKWTEVPASAEVLALLVVLPHEKVVTFGRIVAEDLVLVEAPA